MTIEQWISASEKSYQDNNYYPSVAIEALKQINDAKDGFRDMERRTIEKIFEKLLEGK